MTGHLKMEYVQGQSQSESERGELRGATVCEPAKQRDSFVDGKMAPTRARANPIGPH